MIFVSWGVNTPHHIDLANSIQKGGMHLEIAKKRDISKVIKALSTPKGYKWMRKDEYDGNTRQRA